MLPEIKLSVTALASKHLAKSPSELQCQRDQATAAASLDVYLICARCVRWPLTADRLAVDGQSVLKADKPIFDSQFCS
jgi:hypothetical protein